MQALKFSLPYNATGVGKMQNLTFSLPYKAVCKVHFCLSYNTVKVVIFARVIFRASAILDISLVFKFAFFSHPT